MAKATQTTNAPAKHTTSSAATVATQVQAGNAPANTAVTPTGATGGRKQKLTYAYGTQACKLVPGAAKGSRQKLHLQALQAVYGKARTMQASAVLAGLQAANHPNPRRVMRQAQRAGVMVLA